MGLEHYQRVVLTLAGGKQTALAADNFLGSSEFSPFGRRGATMNILMLFFTLGAMKLLKPLF